MQFLIFQIAKRQEWRGVVSETYGVQGREGVSRDKSGRDARNYRMQNAGSIWEWSGSGVCRRIYDRVLETGLQQVGEMEKSNGKGG